MMSLQAMSEIDLSDGSDTSTKLYVIKNTREVILMRDEVSVEHDIVSVFMDKHRALDELYRCYLGSDYLDYWHPRPRSSAKNYEDHLRIKSQPEESQTYFSPSEGYYMVKWEEHDGMFFTYDDSFDRVVPSLKKLLKYETDDGWLNEQIRILKATELSTIAELAPGHRVRYEDDHIRVCPSKARNP